MAVIRSTNVIELSGTIADFDLGDKRAVYCITYEPGAANDVLIVRDGSATGPIVFKVSASDTDDQKVLYLMGAKIQPVITVSQCTLSAGTTIVLVLGA